MINCRRAILKAISRTQFHAPFVWPAAGGKNSQFTIARTAEKVLREHPESLFSKMYGPYFHYFKSLISTNLGGGGVGGGSPSLHGPKSSLFFQEISPMVFASSGTLLRGCFLVINRTVLS